MSLHYHLTDQELDNLEFEHRHATDKRYADRVKTVYLLGNGWSVTKIAEALLIDRETVRNHFKRYRKGGLAALQRNDAAAATPHLRRSKGKRWISIFEGVFTSLPKKLHIMSNRRGRSPTAKAA